MIKTITLLLLALVVAGCGETNKFAQTFEKPSWFDSVNAPQVNTSQELDTLWHSGKRCCDDDSEVLRNNRIFYKSCFNAINAHNDDEDLVVKCLWLMGVGAEPRQRIELSRFLVDNYSQHKNDVSHCANCMPGDTVARVTLEVAQYESRTSNDKNQSIQRLEKLLDSRRDEISYWVQAEIYEFLGKRYLDAGITKERLGRYSDAYNELKRVKEYNQTLEKRFPPIEKLYKLISQSAQMS